MSRDYYPKEINEDGSVKESGDMTKHNEDNDEKWLKNIQKGLKSPADVLSLIQTLSKTAEDVKKFTEVQKTKRAEIRAQAEVRIREIDSMRDLLMSYLDRTFDERRRIFAKQFECVDKALVDGDMNMLAISLNNITDLAKSSPFKALADFSSVKKQLGQKNTTFDI